MMMGNKYFYQVVRRGAHDAQGNVTGIVDGNGNETSYVLDSWGRITEIRKADGSKENYAYDFAGNIIEAVDGNGNKLFSAEPAR